MMCYVEARAGMSGTCLSERRCWRAAPSASSHDNSNIHPFHRHYFSIHPNWHHVLSYGSLHPTTLWEYTSKDEKSVRNLQAA